LVKPERGRKRYPEAGGVSKRVMGSGDAARRTGDKKNTMRREERETKKEID